MVYHNSSRISSPISHLSYIYDSQKNLQFYTNYPVITVSPIKNPSDLSSIVIPQPNYPKLNNPFRATRVFFIADIEVSDSQLRRGLGTFASELPY